MRTSPVPTVLSTIIGRDVSGGRGWVSQPVERGSIDIIWSCVSTLFVCLWCMLHLNVPAARDGGWTMFWRKSRWLLLSILAPEVPMLLAAGQWASAKRSVQDMKNMGYGEWTLVQAFYADSGGFHVKFPYREPFPITAKQIHYLVAEGYISLPTISQREIWDKSKADRFAKFIAFIQTAWLTTQILARAIQRLPIIPLELATMALVLCSLTTLSFWLHKPLDVETPTVLSVDKCLTDVLHRGALSAKKSFDDTPLDFIEPRIYISRKWSKRVLQLIQRLGLQSHPLNRIPNDRDPQLSNIWHHIVLGVATFAFASIHLVDWDFRFPTPAEQWLWRVSCILMWVLLGVYGTVEVVGCAKENYTEMGLDTMGGYKLKWPSCLLFFVPAALYFWTRVVLIVLAVLSLRSLPAGAFVNVQWTALLAHI